MRALWRMAWSHSKGKPQMPDLITVPENVAAEVAKLPEGPARDGAALHQPARIVVANPPDHALTPEQKQSGIEALRRHWTGTPEELERALAGPTTAPAEQATPINPAIDPPASPSEYRIAFKPSTNLSPAEYAARISQAKAAFHTAGVPVALAQGLADAIERATTFYDGLDEARRKLSFVEQGAQLRRAFGETGAKEIAELASAAYARLPETYRAVLDKHHALHSSAAQVSLANIERAYRARARR